MKEQPITKKEKRRSPLNTACAEDYFQEGLTMHMLPPLPIVRRRPRRIVTRSGYRVRGVSLAFRDSSPHWESPYEANALLLLAMSDSVAKVFAQPLVVDLDGEEYTPDILLIRRDGSRIWIECKPEDRLDDETRRKLGLAGALFRKAGDRFLILTEREVGDELCEVDNCRYLVMWRKYPAQAPDAISDWDSAPYHQLIKRLGANLVNSLIAAGRFTFDFTQPLGPHTLITPTQKGAGYEPGFLRS